MERGNYCVFHLGYLVIKSIAYFPSQCALNSKAVLGAFLDQCSQQGWQWRENSLDADVAVIWSVLWNGRMQPNRAVYQHYKNLGRPVIVIDVGALRRGHTWKIAVDNITAQGYYGHTTDLDWDRPAKLGVKLSPLRLGQPRLIIAAQHKQSFQVESLPSMEHWINQQISQARSHTDLPIIVRPHPRSALDLDLLPRDVTMEMPRHIKNTYDDFDVNYDCRALINYNSGPGIQAALSGCQIIVDPSSLAAPISSKYEDLDRLVDHDRDRWLVEICHTEYTVDEITQGSWLKRIKTALS